MLPEVTISMKKLNKNDPDQKNGPTKNQLHTTLPMYYAKLDKIQSSNKTTYLHSTHKSQNQLSQVKWQTRKQTFVNC